MTPSKTLSRRQFVRRASAACSVLSLANVAHGEVSANNRINLGVVGCGSRGFNLIDDFVKLPDCKIVAVCDVDEFHYRDNAWGKGKAFGRQAARDHIAKSYATGKSGRPDDGPDVYSDYRELMAREDIDAVVVATPDHWHALCTIEALRAGKDVYCEKPVTHTFAEGQAVVSEVARQKGIFQTGSQQRSDRRFQLAVELCRNGVLGDLKSIEVGLPAGYSKPMGSTEILKPRPSLDYDFWCGPSEVLPLMQARFHRWWRGHRAYGGGVLMDWIGHHNDIGHWALGVHNSGPKLVEARNWTFPNSDVYNTPEQYEIYCEFEGGAKSTISTANRGGLKIIGSEGWVWVTRGRMESSDQRWLAKNFRPGSFATPKPKSHAENFLTGIRTRSECIAPAEIAHRSITPGHLGYVSQALQRSLKWDPVSETIQDDAEANRLLQSMHYRAPWELSKDA